MNTVTIVGRLGRDPELKNVGESQVVNFTLAEDYRVKGEKATNWHSCSLWGKSAAALANNLKKGDVVGVAGSIEQRKYTAKDGTEKTAHEVKCSSFSFIPSNKKADEAPSEVTEF